MRISVNSIGAGCLALTTWSSLVLAQAVSPPATPAASAPPAPVFDPQQLPAIRGQVERFTLGPRADIDGFIFKDGTEVKTAPELGTQIAFAIRPGDQVTVHGLKAAALPLFRAVSIADENTQRTVTDWGTVPNPSSERVDPPPRGPAPAQAAASEMSGRVRILLHGTQGEVNGVLLESGEILRFPPGQSAELAAAIQPHRTIVAEGIATTNALGTVVDVQQIGASRDKLVAVAPPPRPDDERGPAGPRRLPPPPPAPPAT